MYFGYFGSGSVFSTLNFSPREFRETSKYDTQTALPQPSCCRRKTIHLLRSSLWIPCSDILFIVLFAALFAVLFVVLLPPHVCPLLCNRALRSHIVSISSSRPTGARTFTGSTTCGATILTTKFPRLNSSRYNICPAFPHLGLSRLLTRRWQSERVRH